MDQPDRTPGPPTNTRLTRRALLALGLGAASASLLAACAPAASPSPTAAPKVEAKPTEAPKPAAPAAPAASPAAAAPGAAPAASPAAAQPATAAPAAKEGPPPPKELTVVQGIDIATLDPVVSSTTPANNVFYNLYGYLALPIPTNPRQLRPELAESWQWTDDRTLRFKLRQGVKFTNGEPFDANSVKYSLDRIRDPNLKSVWAAGLAAIEAINIVDPSTVDIVSKTPYAPLLVEVGRMWMMPPEYGKRVGDQELGTKPVGTGPFKLSEWVKGERVVLEANKEYWRGAPRIDKVTFRSAPEAATRVAELVTGRADIVSEVAPEFQQQIESSGNQFIGVPAPRIVYVNLDMRQKPFNDKRVREALNYAIDVESIVKNVLGNRAHRVSGPYGPNVWGYDASIKGFEFNPDRAKQLLTEAGYPNGFETTLNFGPGRFLKDKEIADALAGQLQKVGVTVKLAPQEYARFFAAFTQGTVTDMQLISLIVSNGDPDLVLKYADSTRLGKYFSDPAVDAAIQKVLTTTDENQRLQAAKEAQQKLVDVVPRIFLFDIESLWGVSKRISWTPFPNDLILFSEISGKA